MHPTRSEYRGIRLTKSDRLGNLPADYQDIQPSISEKQQGSAHETDRRVDPFGLEVDK